MKRMLWVLVALMMSACGGNNDPVLNAVNDEILDLEYESFYVDRTDVYPGETIWIEWRAEGALYFDARLYVSKDDRIDEADVLVVDEDCGVERGDHCTSDEYVDFFCHYQSDNSFTCREDGEILQRNNLTDFFDALPQDAFLILQLCNGNDCERRSWPMLFR